MSVACSTGVSRHREACQRDASDTIPVQSSGLTVLHLIDGRVAEEGAEVKYPSDQSPAVGHVRDNHRGACFPTVPKHPFGTVGLRETKLLAQNGAKHGEQAETEGEHEEEFPLDFEVGLQQQR